MTTYIPFFLFLFTLFDRQSRGAEVKIKALQIPSRRRGTRAGRCPGYASTGRIHKRTYLQILRRPVRIFVWKARSFDQQKETPTQNSSKWQKRLFHNTPKLFIQFVHTASLYKINLQSVRIASGRLSIRTPLFPAPPSDKKRHFRSALPSDFPGNTNCRRRSRTRSSREQQPTAPKPFPPLPCVVAILPG